MCGIFASINLDEYKKLHDLNMERGGVRTTHRSINIDSSQQYLIGHTQAPTSVSSLPHPSMWGNDISGNAESMLWHNGLVKEHDIPRLKDNLHESYQSKDINWDTRLIHLSLVQSFTKPNIIDTLSNIDGSFACVYKDYDNIYIFRNKLSPLFYSNELSLSSYRQSTSGWQLLPANVFFQLDFKNKTLIPLYEFETKNDPFNLKK